jgi:hypothetical protein
MEEGQASEAVAADAGPRYHICEFGSPKLVTVSRLSVPAIDRRLTMAQITLTQDEATILREALSSYVSDLRMEIAKTDSWQFRQNLRREEVLLKKLLEQLDAELASPGASPQPDVLRPGTKLTR